MADLTGKKLGVLLTVAPAHPSFPLAVAILSESLHRGLRVYLYCVDEGVRAVTTPELQDLKNRGVNLFACAYGAGKRSLTMDESAAWSGLTVLADVVGSTDRFISF